MMVIHKRVAHLSVALGLVLGGLVATGGAAAASVPSCSTSVIGARQDGRVVRRDVSGTKLLKEYVSTDPLPFAVDNMVAAGGERIADGYTAHVNTFTSGSRPRNIDVTTHSASPSLDVSVTTTYARSFAARLVAGSGKYYVYAVDGHGRLKRWTRVHDTAGNLWFTAPTLVARHMGGLKTLSYSWSYKIGGSWKDVLYGTTRGGALKQVKVSWKRPGNAKVTTIKKSGFAAYTGLSLSLCNRNATYLSIVAIDRVHNRARWYTLPHALTPKASNLARRGWVVPGADWHLHATF